MITSEEINKASSIVFNFTHLLGKLKIVNKRHGVYIDKNCDRVGHDSEGCICAISGKHINEVDILVKRLLS